MRQLRTYLLLLSTQAAALALGLWLESRFSEAQADYRLHQAVSTEGTPLARAAVAPKRPEEVAASTGFPAQADSTTAPRWMAFFWIVTLQGIVAYLVLSREHNAASQRELRTFNESLGRQHDLLRTRDAVIFGLAKLAESRDPDTGNHLERIAFYSTRLATALRRRPRYQQRISASFVKLIGISSALHDIGKVGIEDSILLKAGPLDHSERQAIQEHVAIGGRCIRGIELRLGRSNFLEMAREIALSHHERWDGAGYPNGLAREDIPLAARIVAVADVYDALSTRRVYKDALGHEQCVEIIQNGAGKHFDPGVVKVFLEIESDFREIHRRCVDAAHVQDANGVCRDENADGPSAAASSDPDESAFAVASSVPTIIEWPALIAQSAAIPIGPTLDG